jgi:hypothetical protein
LIVPVAGVGVLSGFWAGVVTGAVAAGGAAGVAGVCAIVAKLPDVNIRKAKPARNRAVGREGNRQARSRQANLVA